MSLLPATHASADRTFDAVASAYGFDALLSNASIPAGISPEGAGPVAQSELSSLPSGTSFASYPYPGDVVAGIPGLLSGIVIGLPQPPDYPFIVTAGLGQGPKQVNQPTIALSAETQTTHAVAHAVAGTDAQGATADSHITANGDGVTATSTSRDAAVSLGSLGEIGTVASKVSAAIGPDGKVTTSSSLTLTGMSFPALKLTVPKNSPAPAPIPGTPIPTVPLPFGGTTLDAPTIGFVDGQFTVQLPLMGTQQFAVPANAVLSAFHAAGVDVTYSAPVKTSTSIVGATITFHYVIPAPPAALGSVYSGPTDVKMVFGRASASVSGQSDSVPVLAPVGGGGGSGGGLALTPPPGGGSGQLPLGPPASLPATTGGVTGPPPVIGGNPSSSAGQLAVGNVFGRRSPLSVNIYLVLVAAGLIGTFSTQSLRLLGVRQR
jgi:hypothetical protein